MRLLPFLLLMVITSSVGAEEVVYKKHTRIDFSDEAIAGELTRPDGKYLESRKKFRYRRLIKIRKTFRMKILQSL